MPDPMPSRESSQSRSRKRSAAGAGAVSSPGIAGSARKAHKASRACDQCKARKTRCSGTLPCERCVLRRLACVYDADYARGRPPTPPPSLPTPAQGSMPTVSPGSDTRPPVDHARTTTESSPTQGNSPEEMAAAAEVERQDFDPTSGLAFFQRAHQRLVAQQQTRTSTNTTAPLSGGDHAQLLASTGDKPLLINDAAADSLSGGAAAVAIPPPPDFLRLVKFYFENCVVTYRMLAQQKHVASWAQVAQRNTQQGFAVTHGLSHANAAIVLAIVAIAVLKSGRAQLHVAGIVEDEPPSLQKADRYYSMAASLIETEVGLPCLESVQARLIQVLYLLQTSRMNKAWYLLGSTWQVAAALELHRQHSRKRGASSGASTPPDYVTLQGQRHTFWVAYTIDVYLSVVMGRPRHIHDDDVDQELPAAVSDEDMGPEGPTLRVDHEEGEDETDSHMDSVIAHAQLARIIGTISSEVYSIKTIPREERLAAASKSGQELYTLRRQAIAMRLAYCHAVMHANRPFLLGGNQNNVATPALEEESVTECIASAKTALKIVQSMAADSTVLHVFWWTPYVTFCALAVVYIWEIQQSTNGRESSDEERKVMELAEKCHARLAQSMSADSPSWRYTRWGQATLGEHADDSGSFLRRTLGTHGRTPSDGTRAVADVRALRFWRSFGGAATCNLSLPFFQEWQTTDWRDLDASAFGLFGDLTTSLGSFIPNDMS
ncbi:fungal specific transcription factor domain-containing protein [Apiospora hydei]|uniref:Fungal specific transcription factor domain-containing protein n=1 Tax=Apiospora hydei TaxID=1337664 RepID=A0ABR1WQI0_9PEZI